MRLAARDCVFFAEGVVWEKEIGLVANALGGGFDVVFALFEFCQSLTMMMMMMAYLHRLAG